MRVLLDTNVILDAMLQRAPWHLDADAILQAATIGQITCAATTLSVATTFYVGRKIVGTKAARGAVQRQLAAFTILPVARQTLVDADAFSGNDFEDNTLIAAAVSAGVDAIVTRNITDFAHSPIPVWSPSEMLKKLAPTGQP